MRSLLVLLWFDSFLHECCQHPRHCFNLAASFSTSSASRAGFVRLGLGWLQGWLGLAQVGSRLVWSKFGGGCALGAGMV